MENLDMTHLATAVTTDADFSTAVTAYENEDFATATALFQKLSDTGDTEAQYNLARMILDGHVADLDKKDAFQLLAESAANGNEEAAQEMAALKATLSVQELSAMGL